MYHLILFFCIFQKTGFDIACKFSPYMLHIWYFMQIVFIITKTRLFKYIENFTTKMEKFQLKKKFWYFNIPAQHID